MHIPQVFLAKRKLDGKFYAVKVLQKKIVLNRKEVKGNRYFIFPSNYKIIPLYLLTFYFLAAKTYHG